MGLVYLPLYIWIIFIVNLLVNVLYIECLGICWTIELLVPALFLRMFSEFLEDRRGTNHYFHQALFSLALFLVNHLMDETWGGFDTFWDAYSGHSWPNLSNIGNDEHWNEIATLHEYDMDIHHDGLQRVL